MQYIFLIISLLCLFTLGAQFQSAMKVWIEEGASGLYLLAFLAPALIPTIIFGAITIWLFKRHNKT